MRALAVCVALAALSLLLWNQPAYDPTAWLVWGRELTQGTLGMIGGPSWKPLPVGFTFVFALFGDEVAPLLWLVVARASGFVAIVLCFRVAARLGGTRVAGWLAAAGLLLATDFLFNVFRGDSEGLVIALALGAIELHLSGRRRAALALGLLAGLLRPEVWIPLAGYGVWLLRRDRRSATLALAFGGAVALLALWLLPDKLATGEWLRGARRAQNPVAGSPGASAFPFGLTFVYASIMLAWPLYAGAVWAVRDRTRAPAVRGIAAGAGALMVTVAALAEAGFTGNIRYVALPAALVAVLGGVGLPDAWAAVRARFGPRTRALATGAAGLAVAVCAGITVYGVVRLAREERILGGDLEAAVAAAGGERAIRACGRISTTPFERPALAYRLELPMADVWTSAARPGIALIREHDPLPGAAALPVAAEVRNWTVRRSCG